MEVYVDDMQSGKFLGHMFIEQGIEANPSKIREIQEMKPPINFNKVHKLVGQIAALSMSISRLVDRNLPLFKALTKDKDLTWEVEYQQAFQNCKLTWSSCPYSLNLHQPRMAMKAQAIVESMSEATPTKEDEEKWLLYVDGSSTYFGNGATVVLTSLEGNELETIPKSTTREIPFNLVYNSEVLIPAEVELETFTIKHYEQKKGEKKRILDGDIVTSKFETSTKAGPNWDNPYTSHISLSLERSS
ncbi:UNVERIFIED_CONTAM: hypothetical protein Scaly_0100200 [Sesamum calycinum]|uniref:Reverse transcriptase/retrotransposon-derived protein RNase H-like domain-containing protein n=1 Tax=Sesamum calycinum TaxID=2727403 RepID=A0AAW2SVM8_9LAMI